MLPDQPYVRGLEEPLSASEYAKLEGLDEKDVLEAIQSHRLHGVYSLGWYLQAPPYSEERFSRLRAESKLEPRLLNWLQRRADLHDNPQYKSELERLRAHFIKLQSGYDNLTPAEQEALLNTTKYADHPQPVDYGLTYHDLTTDDDWGLTIGVKFKEGKFRTEIFLNILFYACSVTFIGYYILNRNMHRGDERLAISLGLGLTWLTSAILLGFLPAAIAAYKRKHPSASLLAYRQAVCRHKLYVAAARKAEQAAREAEQAFLRKKRSYWEFLDGYAFERATAEVLKRHQFNPRVTPGSADGGIDIEVTRNGLNGVVQCKAHVASVGPHVVRDLYGVIRHCGASFGIIVSRGGFSRGAIDFARDKPILFLDVSDVIAMQEGRDVLAAAFAPSDRA